MAKIKSIIERREQQRFLAVEGAIAALSPSSLEIGPILDISMGGLSFYYSSNQMLPEGPLAIEIYATGNGFYLEKIFIESVSDIKIQIFDKKSNGFVNVRRRGVKFKVLAEGQLIMLEDFITTHTIGKA